MAVTRVPLDAGKKGIPLVFPSQDNPDRKPTVSPPRPRRRRRKIRPLTPNQLQDALTPDREFSRDEIRELLFEHSAQLA